MIACGQDINLHVKQLSDYVRSQAETGSGILAVGNHQIDHILINQARQSIANQMSPRATDDITDKKDFQNSSKTKIAKKKGRERQRATSPTP
jgi:hypothetical protein